MLVRIDIFTEDVHGPDPNRPRPSPFSVIKIVDDRPEQPGRISTTMPAELMEYFMKRPR